MDNTSSKKFKVISAQNYQGKIYFKVQMDGQEEVIAAEQARLIDP